MKPTLLKHLSLALALTSVSISAMAADSGVIKFNGKVLDVTCPISVQDTEGGSTEKDTVELSSVAADVLTSSKTVHGGSFALVTDSQGSGKCLLSNVKARIKFQFAAAPSSASPSFIGLTSDSSAQEVALQIEDANGAVIKPGAESPAYDPSTALNYTVNYIATGIVTAGSVSATANYTIDYQ